VWVAACCTTTLRSIKDENSEQQVDMVDQWKYRDGRVLLSRPAEIQAPDHLERGDHV
jgi:hypothetical protein